MIKSNQPVDLTTPENIEKITQLFDVVNKKDSLFAAGQRRAVIGGVKNLRQNDPIRVAHYIEDALFCINFKLACHMQSSSSDPLDCPERRVPPEQASAAVQLFDLILHSKQFESDKVRVVVDPVRLERTTISLNSICAYQADVAEKHKDEIARCRGTITDILTTQADATAELKECDRLIEQRQMYRAVQGCKR